VKNSRLVDYLSVGFIALIALAGCGGSQNALPAPATAQAARPIGLAPAVKQFGVGLGNAAGAEGTGGSKGMSWTFNWCNGVPYNPSCYPTVPEVPGKRKFHDLASGTANLFNGSQSVGYTKAKIEGTATLGTGSYIMSAETNAKMKLAHGFFAQSQILGSIWDDTLYVSSGSLKKGTPVTIGVKWALTPHTNIACDSAKNSYGLLELYSASITPPSGSQFSISGACSNGTFLYYLYNNPQQKGTAAVGTISTAVGNSYPIEFVTTGQVVACQASTQCVGDFFATLSGTEKFTITSITQGATYTTASGNTYK
jgi:hypothetical protein